MKKVSAKAPNKNRKILRIAALLLPVVCLAVILATTAFAQTTYVITDGDQKLVYTSYAKDPMKVLSEAGVTLSEDDFYTTQETQGVSEITVQRAFSVSIDYCGTPLEATSYGEPVEHMLTRMGVPTRNGYTASVALDATTYDGMCVKVDHNIRNSETYTVEIPFETIYVQDDTMEKDVQRVITRGVPDQMLTVAEAGYLNGVETDRVVTQESVLQQPVNAVIAIGTGENVGAKQTKPLIGDGVIVLPTGEVLTYTHSDVYKATAYTHTDKGCDMITATGTTVHIGTVAVDTRYIPYGTRMFIVSNDGEYIYGVSTAEDCGSSIKGKRLDLYFPTTPECFQFGIRNCTVYFLGDAQAWFW